MGGYGSGRWGWARTRATTDGPLALDVRELARRGLFAAGPGCVAAGVVRWTRRGEAVGRIGVAYRGDEPGVVTLDYETRRPGEDGRRVREAIGLDRTACRLGGSRPWFRCPGCGERRAVLHSVEGLFRCRGCHDLAYGSTREPGWERARRRAGKLRAQLGAEPGEPWGWLAKPKGMHWRTYSHLPRKLDAADAQAEAGLAARHAALVARFDRKYGPL